MTVAAGTLAIEASNPSRSDTRPRAISSSSSTSTPAHADAGRILYVSPARRAAAQRLGFTPWVERPDLRR
jgi:hypothetical protein